MRGRPAWDGLVEQGEADADLAGRLGGGAGLGGDGGGPGGHLAVVLQATLVVVAVGGP